jgi:hypothetical protein
LYTNYLQYATGDRDFLFDTSGRLLYIQAVVSEKKNDDADEGWAYGDVWRGGASEEGAASDASVDYVDILRGDTGQGFTDSEMLDLVGYLGSRGIRATYDSFSLGMEPAAIKTYVLKVEEGKEEQALRCLEEREREQ